MKRKKKNIPNKQKAIHISNKGNVDQVPSPQFINELMNLFNSGQFDLFEKKAHEAIQNWPSHPIGWKALGNLLLMRGDLENALEPLTRCVELAPDDEQALNNLGSVLLELRQLEEATEKFRQALAINTNYAHAYTNLGLTYLRLGQYQDALENYQKALLLQPDFPEAHNNLGNALKELGRLDEAVESYKSAIKFNFDSAEAHYNLANALMELGRFSDAKKSFRQALSINPDYAQAHCGLGDAMLKRGNISSAIVHYQKSIDSDPFYVKAHDGLNTALSNRIPLWHVPMMNDKPRNDAYFTALKNAITPDTHVLEIGTGSGLLAMMAAKLGAKKVTTCEVVPEIAETAKAIVEDNSLTSQINVIQKLSNNMIIGEDMDEQADMLVSEILSSEFLGEGVFSSVEDAKRRLLKPDARIIPARGSIQVALFGGEDIEKNVRVEEVYGFKFRHFNKIVANKQYDNRQDLTIELLSDDISAFNFDFAETDRTPYIEQKTLEIFASKAGRCCGLIQWLRLEMDEHTIFENHPDIKNPAMGWQHCLYIFPTPILLQQGQVVSIIAAHNRNTPWFFYQGVK